MVVQTRVKRKSEWEKVDSHNNDFQVGQMIPELAKREGQSPAKYHTQQETPITFLVTHLIISSGKLHWAEWIALSVTNSPALCVSTTVTERPNISRPLPNKPSPIFIFYFLGGLCCRFTLTFTHLYNTRKAT